MNKEKRILLIFLLVTLLVTGCNKTENLLEQNKTLNNVKCSINNNNGDYIIDESMGCPKFVDIAYSGDRFFITNTGELYEYSDKKYSTTENNCKKVETNIIFDKIIRNTLVSKDGNFYSYYNSNLKEITDDVIQKGRAFYGIDQMEINLYRVNNEIFYLGQMDMNERDIYGYVDGNDIYSITYDWNSKLTDEKLIYTFDDGEYLKKMTNGFVITNKGYYKYGITNEQECSHYEDIKCDYGLVLIDTIDNCSNEIYYISNNLIITQNMVK